MMSKRVVFVQKIGALSALLSGILLAAGLVFLLQGYTGHDRNFLLGDMFLQSWLVLIFNLLAGRVGYLEDWLYHINLLDILILALSGLTLAGLYPATQKVSRAWSIVALVQPFLGIILFLVTSSAGRSAVMGAILVISLVMLSERQAPRWIALMGSLSALLLWAGDLGVGVAPSALLASLFALGYVLLIIWFFVIARRLSAGGVSAVDDAENITAAAG